MKDCVRSTDTAARVGGDEFAVLLDNIKDTNVAVRLAERLQQAISQPVLLQAQEVFTTASIGIAFSLTGYDNSHSIPRDADTAMYQAKQNGKARYELFNDDITTRART